MFHDKQLNEIFASVHQNDYAIGNGLLGAGLGAYSGRKMHLKSLRKRALIGGAIGTTVGYLAGKSARKMQPFNRDISFMDSVRGNARTGTSFANNVGGLVGTVGGFTVGGLTGGPIGALAGGYLGNKIGKPFVAGASEPAGALFGAAAHIPASISNVINPFRQ